MMMMMMMMMQVAQTRLEKRSHRTENENCNDSPHIKIVEEVIMMTMMMTMMMMMTMTSLLVGTIHLTMVMTRMIFQVGTIHSNIEHLNSKLAEAQEAKQDLLAIKHKLEQVKGTKFLKGHCL